MSRIAVIGDKDSVYGFAALGLDTYYTTGDEEDIALFKRLVQSANYAIIYITEAAAAFVEKEIEKKLIRPVTIMVDMRPNSGAMKSTASKAFFIKFQWSISTGSASHSAYQNCITEFLLSDERPDGRLRCPVLPRGYLDRQLCDL